jgi:hypothetical protein
MPTIRGGAGSTGAAGLTDVVALYEEVAEQLDLAAQHCRTASAHFRNEEIPRGAAHAWAAYGHLLEAQDRMRAQARAHAQRSVP